MPDVNFDCPHCRQNLDAPVQLAGKSLACPSCQKNITIPKRDLAPDYINFNCHNCAQNIDAPDQASGLRIRCPGCGDTIRIPVRGTPKSSAAEIDGVSEEMKGSTIRIDLPSTVYERDPPKRQVKIRRSQLISLTSDASHKPASGVRGLLSKFFG